jgi:hypothetical protein
MSFGFSIGDIIACSQLAVKAYSTLKDAPTEFDGLRLELRSLNATLKALADEEKCPTSLIHIASPSRREDMRLLLQNCANSMDDLQNLVLKYSSLGSGDKKRLREWISFASKDKQGPRDKLAIHTASMNMFLTTLSHGSLGRLEFLMKNARQTPSMTTKPKIEQEKSVTVGPHDINPIMVGSSAWVALEDDMASEGITNQHVEQFQEELKAYLRYLVRGDTPFWSGAASASATIGRVSRSADSRGTSLRVTVREGLAQHRAEKKIEEVHRLQEAEKAKIVFEDQKRSRLEEEAPNSLEKLEKEKIQKEKEDSDIRRLMKESIEREKGERQRLRQDAEETRSDKVSQLIDDFEKLFELDHDIALPDDINSVTESDDSLDVGKTEIPTKAKLSDNSIRQTRREPKSSQSTLETVKRIWDTKEKLDRHIAKRDHLRMAGDKDAIHDLEIYVIPETIGQLRELGCRFQCDHCDLPITEARFHCSICEGGNFDVCQDCWNNKKKCKDSEHTLTHTYLEEDLKD